MKTFWVLWTYIANFSRLEPVDATSAENAAERATCIFGVDFRERGSVYVFDAPPAFVKGKDAERVERWREEQAARPTQTYTLYTRTGRVKEVAYLLRDAGVEVTVEGTESIRVLAEGQSPEGAAHNVLAALMQTHKQDFGLKFRQM